ncbi:MAG: YIP1 family protein [Chloroflexota bacterium]
MRIGSSFYYGGAGPRGWRAAEMQGRSIRFWRFDRRVYHETAMDPGATRTAMVIVTAMAIALTAADLVAPPDPGDFTVANPVVRNILGLLWWPGSLAIEYYFGTRVLDGRGTFGGVFRACAYAYLLFLPALVAVFLVMPAYELATFPLLASNDPVEFGTVAQGLLVVLGWIALFGFAVVSGIWAIAGNVAALRAALNLGRWRAVLTLGITIPLYYAVTYAVAALEATIAK